MSQTSPVTQTLKLAHAALLRIRTASIAGCEEGYGKPEKWADELFASHGDVTAAMKAIDGVLSSGHAQPPREAREKEITRLATIEVCAQELERSYPDHAWLNAACAAIRSLSVSSTDRPVPNFFGEKVDAWGAAEWFDRMAKAIHEQDAAVVTKDEAVMEICRNVAASSAMRLVRGYEQQVRAALAVTSPDRTDTRPNRQGE